MFPCVPNAKQPLTGRGFHDATTDAETIIQWWQLHPTANVGIPTEGLVVIDVDGKAPAIPVTAGEAIIGIAWIVVEAFDDTGAVSFGGNVVNISEGSTFDFLVANMSLTDTDNANPEASSGRSQTGLSRYKQRSGVSPNIFSDPVALAASGDARFPYIGGTFVLWDDDASFNFYVPGWAHDGAAGQIRLIYYIAKTELA